MKTINYFKALMLLCINIHATSLDSTIWISKITDSCYDSILIQNQRFRITSCETDQVFYGIPVFQNDTLLLTADSCKYFKEEDYTTCLPAMIKFHKRDNTLKPIWSKYGESNTHSTFDSTYIFRQLYNIKNKMK